MIEDAGFWQRRAEMHRREMQAIKRRLRQYHGGVFSSYAGIGAEAASKLRRELEKHRVAYFAACSGRQPTKQEISEALSRVNSN
jgi:hypothetical protein